MKPVIHGYCIGAVTGRSSSVVYSRVVTILAHQLLEAFKKFPHGKMWVSSSRKSGVRHLWSLWPLKPASAVCFRHLHVTGCWVCYPSLYLSPSCFRHSHNNQPLGKQIRALLKAETTLACGLPASRTTGSFGISLLLLSQLTFSIFQLFIFFLRGNYFSTHP